VDGKLHYDMIARAPAQVALGVELPASRQRIVFVYDEPLALRF
jgi:hypothetical protein